MDQKFIMINKDLIGEYKLVKLMDPEEFTTKIAIEKLDTVFGMPYGTVMIRYVKDNNSEHVHLAVLKQKRKQVITVKNASQGTTERVDRQMFEYNFPQLLFIMDYNLSTQKVYKCNVYMLNPLADILDPKGGQQLDLFGFPMPNLHADHRPCMGTQGDGIDNPRDYIENFYSGEWNTDLQDYMTNRLGGSTLELIRAQRTLSDRIRRVSAEYANPNAQWIRCGKFTIPQNIVDFSGDFTFLQLDRRE